MDIIADLHIHGRYSRGCSSNLDFEKLEKYARIKGIGLLGTGDFTHPEWIKMIKSDLEEDGSGLLRSKSGFPFMLQTELSLIYTQGGRGRKIHNVVLAPSLEVVDQITEALLKRGRIDYDGRPIFKIPCPEFVEMLRGISKDIEVIPAHIWTPWFSLFGANSGFDTVKDCFEDMSKHIHALETGLSSDPAMNWRISQLDKYSLVSFSDSHSFWPWRIGREATVFDTKLDYKSILNALRTKKGLKATVEIDPNFGKYHLTGHRKCDVVMTPQEASKLNNICPKCNKTMTVGVLERVEELADREEGFNLASGLPFYSLIPLSEILSTVYKKGIATKFVSEKYDAFIQKFGSEFNVLLKASREELSSVCEDSVVDVLMQNRVGELNIKGGYDGVYGEVVLGDNSKKENKKVEQKNLFKF